MAVVRGFRRLSVSPSLLYFNMSFHNNNSQSVVMDGAAKVYRNVCAAKPEKVMMVGELNHFNCCVNSPLPRKLFCAIHLNDKVGETSSRLDHGVLTRARRKELGLEIDCLSSSVGCRKPDKVTMRYLKTVFFLLYCCSV